MTKKCDLGNSEFHVPLQLSSWMRSHPDKDIVESKAGWGEREGGRGKGRRGKRGRGRKASRGYYRPSLLRLCANRSGAIVLHGHLSMDRQCVLQQVPADPGPANPSSQLGGVNRGRCRGVLKCDVSHFSSSISEKPHHPVA